MITYNQDDIRRLLPVRRDESHKGSYGTLLLIAGSYAMTGAAIIAARAAYRSGVGLVRVMIPERAMLPLQCAVPEAVLLPYREENPVLPDAMLSTVTAAVIGPGMGSPAVNPHIAMILDELLTKLNPDIPLIIDADGLNTLAQSDALREKLLRRSESVPGQTVLTPHLGEASRLLGNPVRVGDDGEAERVASLLADRYASVTLLKGHRSVVFPSEDKYTPVLNLTGNHGMATAGSGDALSGIIGALAAQGLDAFTAASVGAYIHGDAGNRAAAQRGFAAVTASDIVEAICLEKSAGVFPAFRNENKSPEIKFM